MLTQRKLKSTIYTDIFATIHSDSAPHSCGSWVPTLVDPLCPCQHSTARVGKLRPTAHVWPTRSIYVACKHSHTAPSIHMFPDILR